MNNIVVLEIDKRLITLPEVSKLFTDSPKFKQVYDDKIIGIIYEIDLNYDNIRVISELYASVLTVDFNYIEYYSEE